MSYFVYLMFYCCLSFFVPQCQAAPPRIANNSLKLKIPKEWTIPNSSVWSALKNLNNLEFQKILLASFNGNLGDNIVAIYGFIEPLHTAFPNANIHVVWPFCSLLNPEISWLKCTDIEVPKDPSGHTPISALKSFENKVQNLIDSKTLLATLQVDPHLTLTNHGPLKTKYFQVKAIDWVKKARAPAVLLRPLLIDKNCRQSFQCYLPTSPHFGLNIKLSGNWGPLVTHEDRHTKRSVYDVNSQILNHYLEVSPNWHSGLWAKTEESSVREWQNLLLRLFPNRPHLPTVVVNLNTRGASKVAVLQYLWPKMAVSTGNALHGHFQGQANILFVPLEQSSGNQLDFRDFKSALIQGAHLNKWPPNSWAMMPSYLTFIKLFSHISQQALLINHDSGAAHMAYTYRAPQIVIARYQEKHWVPPGVHSVVYNPQNENPPFEKVLDFFEIHLSETLIQWR